MRVALILIENVVEVYEFSEKSRFQDVEKTPHAGSPKSGFFKVRAVLLRVTIVTPCLNRRY
jgi:hypothetical protein